MKKETLRITVYDLSTADCAYTAEILRDYFKSQGIAADTKGFTDRAAFLYDFQDRQNEGTPYDMAFVGADTMKAVEDARNIREMDVGIPLFLVSEVSDFALEGFRLRVLDYLTKPVSVEAVAEAVGRVTKEDTF